MCLVVDLNLYQDVSLLPTPLKAEENICVYKMLVRRNNKQCRTYPLNYLINFKRNKFYYKSKLECFLRNNKPVVEKGLHSTRLNCSFLWVDPYYAIIPKGANFYIGTSSDIVSDQLIIYKKKPWRFIFKKPISVENYIEKYIQK